MRALFPAYAATLTLLLVGCAHGNAQRDQRLEQLEQELRTLRQEQRRDRDELRKLERHLGTLSQARAQPSRRSPPQPPEGLAVVRLQPEAAAAPKEDDGFIFIVDRGEGSSAQAPAAGRVDSAPPLPVGVTLQEQAPPPDDGSFEAGLAALAGQKHEEAITLLEAFVERAPRDGRADNALLALAEANLALQRPGRALRLLERLITDYPAGDAVPAALLKYGEVCLQTGRSAAARAAFERLVESHPGTPSSSLAQQHLAGL